MITNIYRDIIKAVVWFSDKEKEYVLEIPGPHNIRISTPIWTSDIANSVGINIDYDGQILFKQTETDANKFGVTKEELEGLKELI